MNLEKASVRASLCTLCCLAQYQLCLRQFFEVRGSVLFFEIVPAFFTRLKIRFAQYAIACDVLMLLGIKLGKHGRKRLRPAHLSSAITG